MRPLCSPENAPDAGSLIEVAGVCISPCYLVAVELFQPEGWDEAVSKNLKQKLT